MDNNNLTTLAFSIYSNKGTYALLLGAGISRSSGIPSGWDIVIDLLKKLAALNGENEISDYEQWYKNKFGKAVDYSSLLGELVKTPTERVNLMKSYFEPTEEEAESHLKEPTKAHRAIAQMAKNGFLKVILTTNFDRLLEKALADVGITPQVICHEDDIEGAVPLVHSSLTIVKINGDYIDCRFRNTAEELDAYPPKLHTFLSRIFSEFGLITCGWSAAWDKGLTNIIRSIENRRYASYFTYVGKYPEALKELSDFRQGELLAIENADTFFYELNERIKALVDCDAEHPLNKEIILARTKKYLASQQGNIAFSDLFEAEGQRAYDKIMEHANYNFTLDSSSFKSYTRLHQNAIDTLIPMSILVVRWGKPKHFEAVMDILVKLAANPVKPGKTYNTQTLPLHYWAAVTLLYTTGIACVKYDRFSFLNALFHLMLPENTFSDTTSRKYLLDELHPCYWEKELLNQLNGTNYHTPLSTILSKQLQPYFQENIFTESEYIQSFCTFEYLLSLSYKHIVCPLSFNKDWVPWGEFQWRKAYFIRNSNNLFTTFFEQAEQQKNAWEPIKQGMFGGKYETYEEIKKQVDQYLNQNIHFH
jgi:hypothetical protein